MHAEQGWPMRIPVSKLLRPRLGGSVIDRTWLLRSPASDRADDGAGARPHPLVDSG